MGTRMARLDRRGTFVFGEKVVRNELQYEYPRCRYVRDAPIWGVYAPASSLPKDQFDSLCGPPPSSTHWVRTVDRTSS